MASPSPTGTSGGSSTEERGSGSSAPSTRTSSPTGSSVPFAVGAPSFGEDLPHPRSERRDARAGRSPRVYHQFAAHATTAAATPTSRAVTRPTCHADEPTSLSLSPPSEPPAIPASAAHSRPVVTPHTNPHSGAASLTTSGALRWASAPPTAPATNGTASAIRETTGAAPLSGRAASIGSSGRAPTDTPVGATTVPVPTANPGPSA